MSLDSLRNWYLEINENQDIPVNNKIELLNSYIDFFQKEKSNLLRENRSSFNLDYLNRLKELSNKDKAELKKAFEMAMVNKSLDIESSVFWKVIPLKLSEKEKELYYLIALLYIYVGAYSSKESFAKVSKNILSSDSSKIKFEVLLKSETLLDFFINLNPIIRRIKSQNVSFDFETFIMDVKYMYGLDDGVSKKIKIKWAENFYN